VEVLVIFVWYSSALLTSIFSWNTGTCGTPLWNQESNFTWKELEGLDWGSITHSVWHGDSACEAHRGSTRPRFRRWMPVEIALQVIAPTLHLIWVFSLVNHHHHGTGIHGRAMLWDNEGWALWPPQVLARPFRCRLRFTSGCVYCSEFRAVRRYADTSTGFPCIFYRDTSYWSSCIDGVQSWEVHLLVTLLLVWVLQSFPVEIWIIRGCGTTPSKSYFAGRILPSVYIYDELLKININQHRMFEEYDKLLP